MNLEHRIGELEAALLQWKCPSCGGSGLYHQRTAKGDEMVVCKVCNGSGRHPVAHAALKPALPEFHHGGLWDGQEKIDWFLDNAKHMKAAGNATVVYSNLRAANLVAEDVAHVEGRVFSKLPDYWFTYAGDGYARSYGIPVKASFLWPINQRHIQEAKAREAAAREKRQAAIATIPRDPNEMLF